MPPRGESFKESRDLAAVKTAVVKGMIEAGKSFSEIYSCGYKPHFIYAVARKFGLFIRSKKDRLAPIKEKIILFADGSRTLGEIADLASTTKEYAGVVCQTYKLPTRDGRSAKPRKHLKWVKFDDLKDAVLKPGIDKFLEPLLLYTGATTTTPGRVHRLWNMTLAAMRAGAVDQSDFRHMSCNPEFAHLGTPNKRVEVQQVDSWFSKLRDNKLVTDNVPGLTEYTKFFDYRHFELRRVSAEAVWGSVLPWRQSGGGSKSWALKIPELKDAPKILFYPYMLHEPRKENDLVLKVNAVVPHGLPEDIRADVCQDIIVAVLEGKLNIDNAKDNIGEFIKNVWRLYPWKYKWLSLDQPAFGDSSRTIGEMLSGDVGDDASSFEFEDDVFE